MRFASYASGDAAEAPAIVPPRPWTPCFVACGGDLIVRNVDKGTGPTREGGVRSHRMRRNALHHEIHLVSLEVDPSEDKETG